MSLSWYQEEKYESISMWISHGFLILNLFVLYSDKYAKLYFILFQWLTFFIIYVYAHKWNWFTVFFLICIYFWNWSYHNFVGCLRLSSSYFQFFKLLLLRESYGSILSQSWGFHRVVMRALPHTPMLPPQDTQGGCSSPCASPASPSCCCTSFSTSHWPAWKLSIASPLLTTVSTSLVCPLSVRAMKLAIVTPQGICDMVALWNSL